MPRVAIPLCTINNHDSLSYSIEDDMFKCKKQSSSWINMNSQEVVLQVCNEMRHGDYCKYKEYKWFSIHDNQSWGPPIIAQPEPKIIYIERPHKYEEPDTTGNMKTGLFRMIIETIKNWWG